MFVFYCVFPTATSKHLVYFSLDYRGEVQELSFDQPQVHRLFYGSFHKVEDVLLVWVRVRVRAG